MLVTGVLVVEVLVVLGEVGAGAGTGAAGAGAGAGAGEEAHSWSNSEIAWATVAFTDCSQDTHAEIWDADAEVNNAQIHAESDEEQEEIGSSQLQGVAQGSVASAGAGAGAGA